MGSPDRPRELFNDPTNVVLKRYELLQPVCVEITPEGVYNGNGEFQDPEGMTFRIIGFDRSRSGRERWMGRGWVITAKQ